MLICVAFHHSVLLDSAEKAVAVWKLFSMHGLLILKDEQEVCWGGEHTTRPKSSSAEDFLLKMFKIQNYYFFVTEKKITQKQKTRLFDITVSPHLSPTSTSKSTLQPERFFYLFYIEILYMLPELPPPPNTNTRVHAK